MALDSKTVRKLYLEDGYKRKEIADMLGVPLSTLNDFMRKKNIRFGTKSYEIDTRLNYSTSSPIMDSNSVTVEDLKTMAKRR